jgi:hypothetical protein
MQVSGKDAWPEAPGCETRTTASTTVQRSGHEARTASVIEEPAGASPAGFDWMSTTGASWKRAPAGAADATPRRATAATRTRVRDEDWHLGTSLDAIRESHLDLPPALSRRIAASHSIRLVANQGA